MLERNSHLLGTDLVTGESRIRLLQLITRSAIDCPVAVIFGHACAMNWAGPAYDDVGLNVTDALWAAGYYADLIPTSEIDSGALKVNPDGAISYGAQQYSSAVLYHPEFESAETARFFGQVTATTLFRVGAWTRGPDAQDFEGISMLPKTMLDCESSDNAASRVIETLRQRGIAPCTPASDHLENKTVCPGRDGHIRLLDGTEVLLAGNKGVAGDPIITTFAISGNEIRAEAVGVLAVRLDSTGKLEALAAGGLKRFAGGGVLLQLDAPTDIAYWRDGQGQPKGALQGLSGPVPKALEVLTSDWIRLALPTVP
jgi:hypothetical protein